MANSDKQRLTVTVKEAAKALGFGVNATYGLVSSGRLRAVKLDRKLVVPVAELTAFLKRETEVEAA